MFYVCWKPKNPEFYVWFVTDKVLPFVENFSRSRNKINGNDVHNYCVTPKLMLDSPWYTLVPLKMFELTLNAVISMVTRTIQSLPVTPDPSLPPLPSPRTPPFPRRDRGRQNNGVFGPCLALKTPFLFNYTVIFEGLYEQSWQNDASIGGSSKLIHSWKTSARD